MIFGIFPTIFFFFWYSLMMINQIRLAKVEMFTFPTEAVCFPQYWMWHICPIIYSDGIEFKLEMCLLLYSLHKLWRSLASIRVHFHLTRWRKSISKKCYLLCLIWNHTFQKFSLSSYYQWIFLKNRQLNLLRIKSF